MLGNGREDRVMLRGHIRQTELVFDANDDDHVLTLRLEDPPQRQTVIVPDETGLVLTNASATATLQSVGALSVGSITTVSLDHTEFQCVASVDLVFMWV